ncbi:MAG: ABC transporter ATP-binding protein [Acidobacteriota bacterium]
MSFELRSVRAGYRDFSLDDITLRIPPRQLTALIGPNGCGKSTLFNTMAGLLPLQAGEIRVGDLDLARSSRRALARQVSLLPQTPVIPPAIRVQQLVGYGRAPYQNLLGLKRPGDAEAIDRALERAGVVQFRHRRLSELSGGQRQRAFIAMSLAQDTPIMLFDEPTSFLDIRYQYQTLNLLADLVADGRTVVVVLHDIGQAARYADHLVVMSGGRVRFSGPPKDVVTAAMLSDVYGITARVYADPVTGTPQISPLLAPTDDLIIP